MGEKNMSVNPLGKLAKSFGIYDFLCKIGVQHFFEMLLLSGAKEREQQEAIRAELFYSANESRIDTILSIFEDDESRKVFQKAIQFRRTRKRKDLPPKCKENEYFNSLTPKSLIPNQTVFVDCGAYSGDTAQDILDIYAQKVERVIAFEPDLGNLKELLTRLGDNEKVKIIDSGVWSIDTCLEFSMNSSESSSVASFSQERVSDNLTKVRVCAIDNVSDCVKGAELEALKGAKRTIVRNRPILAICLYHSDEDMLTIPEWCMKTVSDYRYYCRHHSYFKADTILYAIPNELREE